MFNTKIKKFIKLIRIKEIFIVGIILVFSLLSLLLLPKQSVKADNRIAVVGGETPTIVNTGGKLYFNSDVYHSNLVIDNYNGLFSGFVWSEDLGWIDFANTGSSPADPVTVSVTGNLTGRAKVINTGEYIYFTPADYASNVAIAVGGNFSGFAWSADLGWINFNGVTAPTFGRDTAAPNNPNIATLVAKDSLAGATTLTTDTWAKYATPSFSWTAPSDNANQNELTSGLDGYLVYFGTDNTSNITLSGGLVTVGANNGAFVWQNTVGGIDTFTSSATLVAGSTYYLKTVAVDNAGNPAYSATSTSYNLFTYKYDNLKPNSPKYVSVSPSGYTRTNHFTFLWPTTGVDMATDTGGSGLTAYQYKINDGEWSAYVTEGSVTLDDIANAGINIFYLQAVDTAGNADDTPVQANFYFNASAPTAPQNVTVTNADPAENSFGFSWDEPSSFNGSINGYYYSVNPAGGILTSSNTSFTTEKLLEAGPYATQQGLNYFYIVAKDEAGNYDLSSCANISGNAETDGCAKVSFTAETAAPGVATGMSIFDISNRDTEEYAITLKWVEPTSKGTGFAGYEIYRSINNETFASIGVTTGTTYADTGLDSKLYYYYVKSKDNAGQYSSASTTVDMTPTGKYTTAPTLTEDPAAEPKSFSSVITWETSREASSFVYVASSSGGLDSAKATGTPEKLVKHSVTLTGLQPETTYYYKTMWEDVDGNQAKSNTYSFRTGLRPKVLNVQSSDITLNSATVSWKSTTIANSNLLYGKTTAYGGLISEKSGSSTTNHSVKLTDLADSTTYHFQIVATDTDGNSIVSDDYNFDTLTMPKISEVGFEPVVDAASTTLKFGWKTNVPATSVVIYQAAGGAANSESKADLELNHEVVISNLSDKSVYTLQVKSVDAYGNIVLGDATVYTTPLDSRPPKLSNMTVEVKSVGYSDAQTAQLVVSWESDEPATSQVEYGPGISSIEYATKTKEDASLTTMHVVIASGLDPSKIYHLRTISRDAAGNMGTSEDTTVITGNVQKSVLSIIMDSLEGSLGWAFNMFK